VLFDFPCIFLLFAFFSSLKNIRISYRGGHKVGASTGKHRNNGSNICISIYMCVCGIDIHICI
jgi:hypothetical protein